jgi:hypothetical protein
MSDFFPSEGALKMGDIFLVMAHIYKHSISGLLVVETNRHKSTLIIEDRKIVFVISTRKEDTFGQHLLKNSVINQEIYDQTSEYMEKNKSRFGRALIELGFLNYDQIWWWIQDHLRAIIYSIFQVEEGSYKIMVDTNQDIENIVLDLEIIDFIIQGIRGFKADKFIKSRFDTVKHLYLNNIKILHEMNLKPFEFHVYELVERTSKLDEIIRESELLEFDTLRILFLFLILDIVSETKPDGTDSAKAPLEEEEDSVKMSTFTSFDEALKHYNSKYELVYKMLSKEIGPIAHSILQKSIDDIIENLPSFMQKVQLGSDGRMKEDALLKSVWYHEFDKHIGDFLRGLEEILYTEIYAVKKHLGLESEQQVLKWINGIGS